MKFEYYVLNYNTNSKKVEMFNVFNNINVQEWAEKTIRKYLRCPKKFKYIVKHKNIFTNTEEISVYGWEAFIEEINSIIRWQECGRREYEISVGDAFENDCNKLEKWDCYKQCKPNIETICHSIIRQYKEQIKNNKENN